MNGNPNLHSKHTGHLICPKKIRTNMTGLNEYLMYLSGTKEAIFWKTCREGATLTPDPSGLSYQYD